MSDREQKVASLLEELAATFIRSEANPDPLITVTRVSTSKDLKRATVYITTVPDSGEDDALIFLKRKAGDLRAYIKKHSRLKFLPHVEFEIDRGERHRQHMDEVARNIEDDNKQPGAEGGN